MSLKILFDGACRVCHKEVSHYADLDKESQLELVDISSENFNASEFGLCNRAVNLHMHAIDEQGKVYVGIDSFIEIWKRLPRYKILIPVFENKYLRPSLNKGYDIFAHHIRPRLPKRGCDDSVCA